MKLSKLRYDRPAKEWIDALPLGSGALGAMMQTDVAEDRIPLNLDTLWSGEPKNKNNPSTKRNWATIREAILAEDYEAAESLCKEHVLGDWTECYLPAGELRILRPLQEGTTEDYQRELVLNTGVHSVSYRQGEKRYLQESFISFTEDVLCVRMQASSGGERMPTSWEVELSSQLRGELFWDNTEQIAEFRGKAPIYAAPNYFDVPNPIRYEEGKGSQFVLAMKIVTKDGQCISTEKGFRIEGASELLIFLCGQTDYREKGNLTEDCWRRLANTSWEKSLAEHLEAFQPIFERVEFRLGEDKGMVVDSLLQAVGSDEEQSQLYALLFDYARYLLMTSSKPGTTCANLQGIWNPQMRAPWSSNYTVNINTQMNYWMAESAGLSEFHLPLFDLLEKVVEQGSITARELYGLSGWVSHHNIDIWGHSSPVGLGAADANPCVYAMWNMSGAWLCRHLWEHYQYTQDRDFLRHRAYPIIQGAVRFFVGYLTDYDGYKLTIPSTSPENRFLDSKGEPHALSMASTMDIAILKELFENYQSIRRILGMPFDEEVEQIRKALPPYRVGKNGQLQEWFYDYEEDDVNHRHVSHLYGLYPADSIGFAEADLPLREACKQSLRRRGDEGTGWCMAWKACLWARLGEGQKSKRLLENQLRLTRENRILMKGGGIYPNLFCAHPPFQIDGNFGFAASIVEMLLQNEGETLRLLPALPSEWQEGSIKGLKAKGGLTLSMRWSGGALQEISIASQNPKQISLVYQECRYRLEFTETELTQRISFAKERE